MADLFGDGVIPRRGDAMIIIAERMSGSDDRERLAMGGPISVDGIRRTMLRTGR